MGVPDTAVLESIADVVGARGVVRDADALAPHLREWRGRYEGRTPMLVLPATTDEVSRVLAICNAAGVAVVPQGGNTGLCGGAVPDASGTQVLLGTARLNRIRALDAEGFTITAEAGCVLAALQAVARERQRLFALSLAAEGSCQIGGNVATNAGGTNVLRYGNTREQVLGLEVVLASGEVLDLLGANRKNTAGYDLKQLFIGSEGTLGVITAVCCRLYPLPASATTALVAVASPADALAVFGHLREGLDDTLNAFELMPRRGLELVCRHLPGCLDPFDAVHPWYVLIEASGSRPLDDVLADALETLVADGRVVDAVLAGSHAQRAALWRLRDGLSEAQKHAGPSIKHDVAVPLSRMAQFIDEGTALVERLVPGAPVLAFGHVGDGNVHFNVGCPLGLVPDALLARWPAVATEVHDLVVSLGGTFSAEHGIGQLKVGELARLAPPAALRLMRALKADLDPNGILNPGKVLSGD